MSYIYEKEEIVLDRSKTGEQGTFRFRICEELPGEKSKECRLVIQAIGFAESDTLAVRINEQELTDEDVVWDLGSEPATAGILISDPPFSNGDNELCLTLVSSTRTEGQIIVERIDCYLAS